MQNHAALPGGVVFFFFCRGGSGSGLAALAERLLERGVHRLYETLPGRVEFQPQAAPATRTSA
jgi:hypothetical protein